MNKLRTQTINAPNVAKKKLLLNRIYNQRYLLIMLLPFTAWLFIFSYLPLLGWTMAFQNYRPLTGIFGSEWTGFQNFIAFFSDAKFYEVLRNTFAMGLLILVFGTFCNIALAIMINEIGNRFFKRMVQTLSYLPHFVSWVIVTNIFYMILSNDGGILNNILITCGLIHKPVAWMSQGNMFWNIATIAQIWKETGWNAIIYLAAITSIDPQLYEAGSVDGLGRWGKIWHITLPGIRSTILMLLVLSIGSLLNASGFDMSYLLGNSMTLSYSDNIAVYTYRYGMQMGNFSMSSALSVFNSIISLILVFTANYFSKKLNDGEKAL